MQWGLLVEFSCNSPTLYLIAHWRALLVVRSFVLEWRVVATTNKRKRKSKENQKKQNIKLRKIDKRKRKILVSKCTITNILFNSFTSCGLLFKIILSSNPYNFHTLFPNNHASSSTVISSIVATKCVILTTYYILPISHSC